LGQHKNDWRNDNFNAVINGNTEVKRYSIVDKETGEVVADDAMFIGQKAFVDKGFQKGIRRIFKRCSSK